MCSDELKVAGCDDVRSGLLARRELTAAELAHAEVCETCTDAVMETEIEAALERRPEVAVPAEFAVRVAMQAQGEKSARRWARQRLSHGRKLGRHVGRNAAVALLLVMMAVVTMSDPHWLMGMQPVRMTLMLVLMGEVVGIALWLGLRPEA